MTRLAKQPFVLSGIRPSAIRVLFARNGERNAGCLENWGPVGLLHATRVDQPYSSLMLAARITLPHFSVSSPMNLPNSFDEVGNAVAPSSAIRALILGSPSAALISVLSLSMISGGVSFGAPRPPQALASYPGKKSATVGIFGSASERVAVATASARSLPALMCSMDAGRLSNAI